MTENSLPYLLPSLLELKILSSLNLGQNMLSDHCVGEIINFMKEHPSLKSIILSQNKINARNVK